MAGASSRVCHQSRHPLFQQSIIVASTLRRMSHANDVAVLLHFGGPASLAAGMPAKLLSVLHQIPLANTGYHYSGEPVTEILKSQFMSNITTVCSLRINTRVNAVWHLKHVHFCLLQFEKYVTAAWAAGYKVREEVVGEFGEAAAAEYAARNVHGVPHDKILMMLDQWQQ